MLSWIKDYLSERTQTVKIVDHSSDFYAASQISNVFRQSQTIHDSCCTKRCGAPANAQRKKITNNFSLRITNYVCHRKNNTNHRGGVALIIKNFIPHQRLDIEVDDLEIPYSSNYLSGVIIATIYLRPGYLLTYRQLSNLTNIGEKTLMMCDFNGPHIFWTCNRTDHIGNELFDLI